MRIAVLVIHRGDRPKFLENLKRMIGYQTIQPDIVHYVDFEPTSEECDISKRYRLGYEYLKDKADIILFMEVDDWYAKDYIETMINEWIKHDKPKIFGTNYTVYYHIKLFSWFTFLHNTRSSAMSTLIVGGLDLVWPVDREPFTDVWLWMRIKGGITFNPGKYICLGIKHGTTITGGKCHIDKLHRYIHDDKNHLFLKSTMDEASYEFYSNYIKDDVS